jgi:hypothetical protein
MLSRIGFTIVSARSRAPRCRSSAALRRRSTSSIAALIESVRWSA